MVADEAHLLKFRQRDVEQTTHWLFAGMMLVIILVIALALIAIANERRRTLGLASSRNALALANEKLVQEAVHVGYRVGKAIPSASSIPRWMDIAHDFNNMLAIVMGTSAARLLATAAPRP
jgi:hypothetical protein